MKNRNLANYLHMALLQLLILGYLAVNVFAHGLGAVDVLKIFAYQLLAWFLVGYATLAVSGIRAKNFAVAVGLSYAFGSIISLLTYMAFMTAGLRSVLPYAACAEALIAAVLLIVKKTGLGRFDTDTFSMAACLILLAVYFAFTLCAVSFDNTMPGEIAGSSYYVDWAYWAGNNIGFTKAFPSDHFFQVGIPFAYHYFSSILIASVSLVTGVAVNVVTFYLSPVFAGVVLVFAACVFASSILTEKRDILILMMAMLLTDGSTVTLTGHLYICPFGFDYGFAYGMIACAFLAEILLEDRFRELVVPSCFMIAMATGCKGPVGCIVLAAYGVAAFFFLLEKKFKRGLLGGLAWLASFLTVYCVFIMNHDGRHGLGTRISYIGGLGLNSLVTSSRWIAEIYEALIRDYRIVGDRPLVKLYAVWLYIFRADHVIAVLFIIAAVSLIRDIFRKKADRLLYCMLAAACAGILLAAYTTQNGGSQMYFMMAAFPPAAMAGMYAIGRWRRECPDEASRQAAFRRGVMILLVCVLGISMSKAYATLIPKVREGVSVVRNRLTYADYGYPYYYDTEDYEAFIWLRDHSPEDAVFAMDTFVTGYGVEVPMLAGVFAERYVYNEQKYVFEEEAQRRANIVAGLAADPVNASAVLASEGVTYLASRIQEGKTEYGMVADNIHEVYRNSRYIIYELQPYTGRP